MESNPMKTKLMYRAPGERTHRDITNVLDDIIVKLQELEERIIKLEEQN